MSNDAMTTLQEQIAKLNQITQNGFQGFKGKEIPQDPGAKYTGILENPATSLQQGTLHFRPVVEADDPLAGYQLPQKESDASTAPTDYSGVTGKLRWGKNFATSIGQGVADTGTHQLARGGNGIVEWFLDEVGNIPQWVGKEGYNNIDNVRTLLRKEEGYDKLKAVKQKDLLHGGDPSGATQAASLWGIKMGAEENEATRGDWNKYFGLRWNRYVNAIRRGEVAAPKDEKAATILAGMKEFEKSHPHKFDVLKPETLVAEAKDQYLVPPDSPEFKQRFDSSNDMADRWGEDATKHAKIMNELSAKRLAGKTRSDPEYWGYKVGQNGLNYALAIGATALTKNPAIGAAIVAAPVAGDAYASAREAGYSPEYSASYAALYGAAEYFPEKLVLGKLVAGAGSGILKQAASNAVMEGTQEGITEIAQMALDQGYKVNDDPNLTFQKAIGRVFDAMVLGGIMGGMGGASHATLNKALAATPMDRAAARDSYLQEFNNIRQALEQWLPKDQLDEIIRNPAPASPAPASQASPTPTNPASPAPTNQASPAPANPASPAPTNPTDLFSQSEIDFLNDPKNPLNSANDAQTIQGAQEILANPDPALDPYRQNAETLLQGMRTKYDPSSLAPQVQQWEQHRSAGTSMWSTPPSRQAARYSQAENDALINHFNKTIGRGTQVIDTSGILPDGSVLRGEGVTLPDGRVIMNFDNISPQISTVTGQQILSREDRAAIVGNHELSHRAERGFVDSLPDGGQLYNEIRQRLATNQVIGNLARAIQAERVAQVSAGQQAANTLIDDYTAVSEAYAELMGALARPRGYEALVDRYLDYLPRKIKKPALRRLIDKTAAGLRNIFAKWTGKNFTPQTLSNQEVADIFASINSHRYHGLKNPAQQVSSPTAQATGPSHNPISRTGIRQAPVFSTRPAEEYAAQLVNRVLGDINGFNTWLDNFVLVKTWSDNDIHILATSLKFNEQLPDDRLARLFDKFTHTWDFYKPWRQHDYNFASAANDLAILARALPDEQAATLSIPDNLKEYFGYYRGIQAARYTKLKNFYDNLESTSYPATLPAMRNITLQNILLGTYGWGETQVKTPEDIMAEVKALRAVRFHKEVEQSIYVAAQIISTSGATNELVNATVNKLVAKHPAYADRITQFMQSLGSISSSALILGAEGYISLIEKLATQKLRARKPVTYEWRGHEFTSPPEKGKPALVASHEMTLWKLKEVLHNEGKLAAPSIALARADTFNGIGWGQMEIAFLADLASIPENNYIFSMDAYTPVFSPYTSGTIEDINNSLVDDVQLKFSSGGREEYYIEELLSEESPEYPNLSIFERTALSPLLTAKQTDEAREVIGTKSLDDLQKLLYKYETQVRAETKIMAEKFGLEWGLALAGVGTETLRIMGSDKLEGLYTLQEENPKAYQYMRENISPIIEEAKQEILGRGKYMELKVLDTVPLNKFSAALLHKGPGTENYSEQLAELVADGVALIWAANPKHIHNAINTGLKQATNTFPNLLFSTEPVQATVNLEEYTAPKVGKAALHNLLLNRLATAQVEAKPLSFKQLSSYVAQLDLTPFPKAVRRSLYNAASIVAQQPSQLGSMVSQLAELHPAYAAQTQSFIEAAAEAASGLAALPPSSRESVLEAAALPISSPKKTTYTFHGQEFTSPPEKGKTPLTITQSMGYHKLVNLINSGGKLYAPSVAIINPENFDGVALGGMDVTFIGSIASLPENTLLFGADAYTPSFEESMAGGTPEEIASQIAAMVTASHGSLETRLKEALAAAQGSTVFGNSIVDTLIAPNMTAEQVEENRGKVGTLGENTAEVFYVVDSFLNEYSEAITNTASSIFNEVVKSDIAEMKQAISKEFAHQVLGVPYESMPDVKLIEKVDGLREWLAKDIEPYATGLRENTLFRLPYLEGKVLEAMPLSNFKVAVVHTAPSTQEQQDAIDKLEKSGVPVIYSIDNLKEGVKQAASIMPDLLFSTNQFFNTEEDTSSTKPALEDVAGTITLAELQAYPPRDTTSINWEGSPVLQDLDALAAALPSEVLKGPVLYAMQNDLFSWGQKRDLLKNWAATGALPPGYLQHTPFNEIQQTLDSLPQETMMALVTSYNMRWEKLKEKWIQEARQAALSRPVQLDYTAGKNHSPAGLIHSLLTTLPVMGEPLHTPSTQTVAELINKLNILQESMAEHANVFYQAAMVESLGGRGSELLEEYIQDQNDTVAKQLHEDWDTLHELRSLAFANADTFVNEVNKAIHVTHTPATVEVAGYEFTSPPQEGKTPFILAHAMSASKLQLVLQSGGLVAPSIAITKSSFRGLDWVNATIGFIMDPTKLRGMEYVLYRGDSYTPTWHSAQYINPEGTTEELNKIAKDLTLDSMGTMEKWISHAVEQGNIVEQAPLFFRADIISGQQLEQGRESFEKPKVDYTFAVNSQLKEIAFDIADITGGNVREILKDPTYVEWMVRALGRELGWDVSLHKPNFEVTHKLNETIKKAATWLGKVMNGSKYRELKITDFVRLEDFSAVQVTKEELESPSVARIMQELVARGLVVIPVDAVNSNPEDEAFYGLSKSTSEYATQNLLKAFPNLSFSLQPPNPNSLQSPELQSKISEAINQNLLPQWEKIMEQWVATNKLYGGEESWAVASDMGETELEYEDWVTVRTPAFKKWFGDWEDGKRHSIVVNPRTGEPLKVYHGSLARFDTFSFKHLGSTGSAHGHGFYFTDDPQLAAGYAAKGDEVGHIYSGFLNIRRLLGENTKKLRRRDVYNLLHKMVRNGSEILWDFNDLNKYQLETVLSQAVDQLFDTNTNDADILAELGNLDNVEDVHRAFGGSPGYQYTLPDGRHYYIALLPNQFKAVNNYGSFSPRQDNMMFSTQPRSSEAALATAYSVPPWELREDLPGFGSMAKRLWQVITSDRVKDLWADKQGELERIVKKLPGNDLALAMRNGWKAYNAQVQADLMNDIRPMQEALSADLAEQLNRVRATIPMYKGMRKSKAMKLFMEHLDKIGKYVYHGEERNMEIALRTGGADLAGSGRTLPEIAAVKQFFLDPARGGGELLTIYENIYNTHIKPMLKYSEDRLRAAGLLTPEMEAARPNYKWYIPLYGKPEIEDPTVSHNIDDSFRSRTGGGALARDTLANRTHNAEGRHGTEAHNLFENIFTQLESTVRRVRAQEPKQRLWEFLQTPEGAAAFDATTSQHQLGNQATVNQAGQQTWRNQATADNQVIWQNGNDVHVMTIGNELALNAVKNFNRSLFPYEGNPLAQPGAAAWHGVAWVTRFMGSMYTRYNPSFILRNKMMDSLQQWQYILADAPVGGMTTATGPRGYLEAAGNVAGRLKLALLAASYNTMWTGTLGKTRGFEQWYKRYEALGGVTTYASFLGRNTLINLASDAWRQAANPIEKALDVRGNLNWLAELLNKANDTMELTTRVSAFRALVESGVGEETATHYVKDIMNFETKGDIARGINAFYPFFTTSLFDMRRILKTLSHKEGQVLLAALVGISYTMWAALAAATGDDDDGQAWVDKYPMGIASRYAIVPVVSDDGVMRGEGIRIPLGFGLGRIANTIALSWRRYFNGTDEPSDLVSNLVNHAMIGSLSPIQPSDVNIKEDPVTWLGNTFLPQVLKPVLQYSSNKNWRGQPIYNPGTSRSEGELDYNTGFAATPDLYKSLAEKLYDGTGYDVAPESIAYWVETAFGGLGRDVVSSTEFFMDKTGMGEPPTTSWWRNIPMLGGLTQSSPSITREKYFEYRMAVEDEYNRLMDANKRGKSPDAYMRSYGYKKQFDAVEAQLRELRKYRKQVREGLHGAERQAAERQLNDAMQVLQANMVKLYEEQTGRKK